MGPTAHPAVLLWERVVPFFKALAWLGKKPRLVLGPLPMLCPTSVEAAAGTDRCGFHPSCAAVRKCKEVLYILGNE